MERPILFSGPMVKAILSGRKTQTRRVARAGSTCRYAPGDLLWVRESFKFGRSPNDEPGQGVALYLDKKTVVGHKCHPNMPPERLSWCRRWVNRPSIFMPRWASRITLQVTAVRCEPLHAISEEDAISEGVTPDTFVELWDSINAKRGYAWHTNPMVWVIEFIVITDS